MSKFEQLIDGLVELYLYPDQVIFGHLMNPHIKCAHNYQVTNTQKDQNKEIIIYQKQMSKTKINSMLNLMQGKSNPLFKSSLSKSKSNQMQGRQSEEQDYQDEQDYDQDEDSYEDQMYMLQKDYENYYDQEYDEQQNPLIAFGQSTGVLPKMKNLKSYNYNELPTSHNYTNSHLYKSDSNVNSSLANKQIDLARVKSNLVSKNTQSTNLKNYSSLGKKQQKKPNSTQNKKTQSQQEWQTQSEEEVQ